MAVISVITNLEHLAGEDLRKAEEKLFAELHAVLSKLEHGVTSSSFAGEHVSGSSLHLAQDAPGVEHARETTDEPAPTA